MYGGMAVFIHIFLTSAQGGCECSASRLGRFTPEIKASSTHWIGGWVSLSTGLDDVEKRIFALSGLELLHIYSLVPHIYTYFIALSTAKIFIALMIGRLMSNVEGNGGVISQTLPGICLTGRKEITRILSEESVAGPDLSLSHSKQDC
jgi:hypothetical protein